MDKRVALVIGNASYTHAGTLKNPANDAVAMAGALGDLGFQVIGGGGNGVDLTYGAFAERLRDFGRALREADVALLFFAGHGLQVNGRNYLVPVDAALEFEADVGSELFELQTILNQIEKRQRTCLVFLDACRNNPLARNLARAMGLDDVRSAGISEGLVEQKVSAGTLIGFATQPEHVAYDGASENGYFTEALLEQLKLNADREVELLLKAVRAKVLKATEKKPRGPQIPWVHSALIGEFRFALSKSEAALASPVIGVTASADRLTLAAAEWNRIKETTDAARLARFEQHFAGTYYAGEATARRQELEEELKREERHLAEGRVKAGVGAKGRADVKWIRVGSALNEPETFRDWPDGPEMVAVPAGSFLMGSPESEPEREHWKEGVESPRHKVAFAQPFAVSRYAVTFGEFAAFIAAADGDPHIASGAASPHGQSKSWRDPGFRQTDRHPVVCTSWFDAKAYIGWLNRQVEGAQYRLLSESEWEYCCRAETITPFWWGYSISPEQANYDGNFTYKGGGKPGKHRGQTVPADAFEPNLWGLYQMHGNVWEWVEDVWHENYDGAPCDGDAWIKGGKHNLRVVRGGSWSDIPQNLRAANRIRIEPGYRDVNLGFRVARTLNPKLLSVLDTTNRIS